MASTLTDGAAIEIDSVEDPKRVVDRARGTKERRRVRVDGGEAVIAPAPRGKKRRTRSDRMKADDGAFLIVGRQLARSARRFGGIQASDQGSERLQPSVCQADAA